MAQLAAHVALEFTCGFARRNCPHDAMFLEAYQRTNRTRGTKILRCFPHCCPRHVDRSYCGGPLYLQVDLTVGDFGDVDDASLCVFAHFHPKTMPGLARGQFVARSMFRDNQQTDTNATGEWIGARLMASADHTTWMFEVNPSGRWYYQWESGATKAQRATAHVFEAYVLVVDPVVDRCEVVATTISSQFRMLSFRRAPASEAKTSSSNTDAVAVESSPPHRPRTLNSESKFSPEERDENEEDVSKRWPQRDSIESALSSDAEIASQLQSLMPQHHSYNQSQSQSRSRTSSPQVDMTRRRLAQQQQQSPLSFSPQQLPASPPVRDHHMIHSPVDTAPLSLLPSPHITRISHELGTLLDLCQTLPSSALELVTAEIRRGLLTPVIGSTHSLSLSSLLAPPSSSQHASSTTSPFPPALTSVVLRVVLFLLFDREWTRTQEAYLQHASADLLDKAALYASYFAWLERIAHELEAFLSTLRTNATLTTLARDARRWLRTAPPHTTSCRGLESFVAQAREVFLSGEDVGRTRRRQSTAETTRPAIDRLDGLRLFSTEWVVDSDSIQWHGAAAAAAASPSAFLMLWAWRQVLALEFTIHKDAGSPPALTVASLWNPSRATTEQSGRAAARGARLVLDGKPRWLRVFPSGESTSSVALGRQRLGHYVASFRHETHELLVNLYTWPRLVDTPDACCYCLRWCLRLDGLEGDALDVRVAVESGHLSRDADIAALDERSLTFKLQAVENWTTVVSLHYAYQRR